MLVFPVFGGLLYLLVSFQRSTRWADRRLSGWNRPARPLQGGAEGCRAACRALPARAPQLRYLEARGFAVYQNTHCDYYPSGEEVFAALLPALEQAEKYIFLSSSSFRKGRCRTPSTASCGARPRRECWCGSCTTTWQLSDPAPGLCPAAGRGGHRLSGVQPFRPVLSSIQNNRDHRKIVSIDGRTAFTGGFNLADEYINAIEKHGHWKDAGICLRGDAAWGLTLMFLQMWGLASRAGDELAAFAPGPAPAGGEGFVQPYADSPLDKENTGEHVYMQIINRARRYVYITTPYLIVDDSMISALALAAKSGVDVRIITPHHWDKWIVHMTTRAYYRPLLEAGVRLYEYSPGFLHAKIFVSDDEVATVGTVNLDYRSLYLHFECGTALYQCPAVAQVKADFQRTLAASQELTLADCRPSLPVRLFQELLRLAAPLM